MSFIDLRSIKVDSNRDAGHTTAPGSSNGSTGGPAAVLQCTVPQYRGVNG